MNKSALVVAVVALLSIPTFAQQVQNRIQGMLTTTESAPAPLVAGGTASSERSFSGKVEQMIVEYPAASVTNPNNYPVVIVNFFSESDGRFHLCAFLADGSEVARYQLELVKSAMTSKQNVYCFYNSDPSVSYDGIVHSGSPVYCMISGA